VQENHDFTVDGPLVAHWEHEAVVGELSDAFSHRDWKLIGGITHHKGACRRDEVA
jgi:hypothetical protein